MLQSTDPLTGLIQWLIIFLQVWAPLLIVLVLVWVVLALFAGVLIRFLRKRANRTGFPSDALNGLILAIRLIFIWIGIALFAVFIPDPLWAWVVVVVGDASVIIGLAVGIAVSQSMRNFISGLYVLFTDPFDVGDYVRIGNNEGIILEVSMNYTKLRQIDGTTTLIPNSNVMSSSVTNFRFRRKPKRRKQSEEDAHEHASLPRRIWSVISQAMDTSKLIQYTLQLKFPVKKPQKTYEKILDRVCKQWEPKFGFMPVYAITDITHLAFTYSITIFVDDPQLLLENRSEFIRDIGNEVYKG
ncbi:MAG: mechanosensitive ion channel family protein [Candidatus Hodarchaeota archaeon]